MAKLLKKRSLVQVSFLALSTFSLLMVGCSGESDDTAQKVEQVSANNTMDVKQPVVSKAPKASLQSDTLPVAVLDVQPTEVVDKVVKEVVIKEDVVNKVVATKTVAKEVAAKQDKTVTDETSQVATKARSGKEIFTICAGCHSANAGGGLGPRLNNQKPANLVAKLTKYKAGEQVGPMSSMMMPMAKGLSHDEMVAVAEYIVTLK